MKSNVPKLLNIGGKVSVLTTQKWLLSLILFSVMRMTTTMMMTHFSIK